MSAKVGDTINERLAILIKALGYNTNSFANAIGFKAPSIANLLPTGRNSKPGYDTTVKILTTFSQVSPEWLLLGVGEMFKDVEESPDSETKLKHYEELLSAKDTALKSKDGEIEALREMVKILKEK